MASEEMSFENADGRWRIPAYTLSSKYSKLTYEPSAQVS